MVRRICDTLRARSGFRSDSDRFLIRRKYFDCAFESCILARRRSHRRIRGRFALLILFFSFKRKEGMACLIDTCFLIRYWRLWGSLLWPGIVVEMMDVSNQQGYGLLNIYNACTNAQSEVLAVHLCWCIALCYAHKTACLRGCEAWRLCLASSRVHCLRVDARMFCTTLVCVLAQSCRISIGSGD